MNSLLYNVIPLEVPRKQVTWTWRQVVATITVSIASMLAGYTAAYFSPAIASLRTGNFSITKEEGHLTESQESIIGSLSPFFAIFGAIVGGPLIECMGRKSTLIVAGPPIVVAWLCIGLAESVYSVYVGRRLCGFCVGILSLCFPIYLAEILHPEIRGSLGLLPTIFGNSALDFCYILGHFLNWRGLAFVGCLFPMPYLCLMVFIPETPRWYVSTYDTDNAEEALQWLRGSQESITEEIDAMEQVQYDADKVEIGSCLERVLFWKMKYWKPILICMGLMFFQQMTGINAVIYYTADVFKESGSTVDVYTSMIIVGTVNVAASITAAVLVDRWGRKILLYISGAVMALTLLVLGVYFHFKTSGHDVTKYSSLALPTIVVYIFAFSVGFGPIPWLMMGEILPAKIRGRAASLVVSFHWASTFAVTFTFKLLLHTAGIEVAFWLYSGVALAAIVFTYLLVPETRKKSLEELEDLWKGPRDLTSKSPPVIPTPPRPPKPIVLRPDVAGTKSTPLVTEVSSTLEDNFKS